MSSQTGALPLTMKVLQAALVLLTGLLAERNLDLAHSGNNMSLRVQEASAGFFGWCIGTSDVL